MMAKSPLITRLSPPQLHIGFMSGERSASEGTSPIELGPGSIFQVPYVSFPTDNLSGRWGVQGPDYVRQFLAEHIRPFQRKARPRGYIFFWIHKGLRKKDKGEINRFLQVAGEIIRYNQAHGSTIEHGFIVLGRGDTVAVRRRIRASGLVFDNRLFNSNGYKRWFRHRVTMDAVMPQRPTTTAHRSYVPDNSKRRTG